MRKKVAPRTDTSSKSRSKPKKAAKAAKKKIANGEYSGLAYESGCELAALHFFFALKKAGYVERIERSPTYLLTEAVTTTYVEQLKRSSKSDTQTIANGHTYTSDFVVWFNSKALGKFIWDLDSNVKWNKATFVAQKIGNLYRVEVEVKPDHSRNSTTPKAVNDMKFVYHRYKMFINLFRPDRVFSGLFCPLEYFTTPGGKPRRLRFSARTLSQYLSLLR